MKARSLMSVPDIMEAGAQTFRDRAALYGPSYKTYGAVMSALFPEGLMVNSVDDWNRLGVLTQVVGKLVRYTGAFDTGGHLDSAHDLMVYGAILQELTDEGGTGPRVRVDDADSELQPEEQRRYGVWAARPDDWHGEPDQFCGANPPAPSPFRPKAEPSDPTWPFPLGVMKP